MVVMQVTAADVAFRKFLQFAHREHCRWQEVRDRLKPLWKSLYEYDEMYAQVTKENADVLFGEDELDNFLLAHLRTKLEVARQDDLAAASEAMQEMRSVFHSVRCALIQLEYDLDSAGSAVAADESTNLRPSFSALRETCRQLLQGLSQDVCEANYSLEMLTIHRASDPDSIRDQFTELLFRLIVPLKPYLAEMGVSLSTTKTLPSTPKSSRTSTSSKFSRDKERI